MNTHAALASICVQMSEVSELDLGQSVFEDQGDESLSVEGITSSLPESYGEPALPREPSIDLGLDLSDDEFDGSPSIVNIVVKGNLGCEIDLREFSLRVRVASFDPETQFHAVVRYPDASYHTNVFASGNFQLIGCKSRQLVAEAVRRLLSLCKAQGLHVTTDRVTVSNMVAKASVPFAIQIDALAQAHHLFAQYNPEVKSSVTYRLYGPPVTCHIFANGRVVLLGAKSESEIDEAWRLLSPVLGEFRATTVSNAADREGVMVSRTAPHQEAPFEKECPHLASALHGAAEKEEKLPEPPQYGDHEDIFDPDSDFDI